EAGPGADLVAELAQPVDVAAQRARTHPEPLAQLAAGPRAVRLEQGEEPQGAGGGVGHVVEPSAHRGQDLTASTPTVVPWHRSSALASSPRRSTGGEVGRSSRSAT